MTSLDLYVRKSGGREGWRKMRGGRGEGEEGEKGGGTMIVDNIH